jgi:predicted small integral membrane protein
MSAPSVKAPSGLLRLGTLPVVVAVLTLITAAYYLLVAIGNITDFGTNQQFVLHVFEMDTTFNDEDVMWRAIGSSAIQNLAYLLIIAWEVLIAAVLIWALVAWVGPCGPAGRGYERPRRLSTLGWTMILLLFAGGFIVIGGEWFQMWQSEDWNGLDPALQNVIVAGLALVLAHLPSRDWD